MLNTAAVADGMRSAYVLPPLQYPYKPLEPHVDRLTMQLHPTSSRYVRDQSQQGARGVPLPSRV